MQEEEDEKKKKKTVHREQKREVQVAYIIRVSL